MQLECIWMKARRMLWTDAYTEDLKKNDVLTLAVHAARQADKPRPRCPRSERLRFGQE